MFLFFSCKNFLIITSKKSIAFLKFEKLQQNIFFLLQTRVQFKEGNILTETRI